MDFETFSKLVDEGDVESIANVLADLSEQDQNDLVDMLSPEQAIKLIAMVNTPNTAVEEETQLSDNSDIVNDEAETEDVLGMKLTKAQIKDMEANGIDPETYVRDRQSDYNRGFDAALTSEDGTCPAGMGDAFEDGWSDGLMNRPETEDVNSDGDTDVATADTNGNGEKDTAVVTADSEPEKKEAVKAAKEDLGLDKKDKTSTGKTKGELEDDKDVVSDEKKKDMTCSDATQKNIMAALLDHRF